MQSLSQGCRKTPLLARSESHVPPHPISGITVACLSCSCAWTGVRLFCRLREYSPRQQRLDSSSSRCRVFGKIFRMGRRKGFGRLCADDREVARVLLSNGPFTSDGAVGERCSEACDFPNSIQRGTARGMRSLKRNEVIQISL